MKNFLINCYNKLDIDATQWNLIQLLFGKNYIGLFILFLLYIIL